MIGVPVPATSATQFATNNVATNLADSGQANAIVAVAHDAFVFATNFGQAAIANFAPETDTIQFSKTNFADISALLAAVHNDGHGNAVITDAANDTLVIEHVTAEQLYAHQQNFHII